MSDLISRQAVIYALSEQAETMSHWNKRYEEQRRGVLTAVNIVECVPSIDAVPKWIPCSERLPEAGRIVLVVGIEAINNIAVYGIKCWDVDTWRPVSAPSVRWDAWMPLPKPYEVKE